MKRFRSCISVLLLCACLTTLCACGNQTGDDAPSASFAPENASGNAALSSGDLLVFSETPLSVQTTLDLSQTQGVQYVADRIYLWGDGVDDATKTNMLYVERFSPTDAVSDTLAIPLGDEEGFAGLCADEDGNLYVATKPFSFDMSAVDFGDGVDVTYEVYDADEADGAMDETETPDATEAPDDAQDEEDETVADEGVAGTNAQDAADFDADANDDILRAYDKDGALLWESRIAFDPEHPYGGSYSLACDFKDGALIVSGASGVLQYDLADGAFVRQLRPVNEWNNLSVVALRNGSVLLTGYDGDRVFSTIDLSAENPLIDCDLPDDVPFYDVTAGADCDLCFESANGVSVYNFGDEASTKVVSYTDSDLIVTGVQNICALPEDRFLLLCNADSGDYTGRMIAHSYAGGEQMTLSLLSKVDPADVKEKTELTLATTYVTTPLSSQVVRFNKASDDYRIRLIDYSSYSNSDNWSGAAEQFNADLISGVVPDMVALDAELPVNSYIAKGLFAPLDDYLDADPDLARADLLENVYQAYRMGDKTYAVIPSFEAAVIVAKSAYVDGVTDWSLDTVEKIIQEKNIEWRNMFGYTLSRNTILQAVVLYAGERFIDWENGICDFRSEEFLRLLEFAARFASEEEAEAAQSNIDWNLYDTAWRADNALLNVGYLGSFNDYRELRYVTFGEPVTAVGFPLGALGTGNLIIAEEQIAMSAATKHPDVCWEFLRGYLLPDYQENISYGFPVSKQALDKSATKAQTPETYIDEDGVEQVVGAMGWLGNEAIELSALTEEDTDDCIRILTSITGGIAYNERMLEIVTEEAEPFFKGQKTAEDVANIIQNRIQVYLDENS